MKNILDFSNRNSCEETMRKTWLDFTISLATQKYAYDEIEKALQDTFLHVFDDMFQDIDIQKIMSITLADLNYKNIDLCRGTILKPTEKIDFDRFIPKAEFIKDDNRFSPKGIEWLYLSIGEMQETKLNISDIEKCCIAECRAVKGNRMGLCHFVTNKNFLDRKVIDLTISDDLSYKELNDKLTDFTNNYMTQCINNYFKYGTSPNLQHNDFIKKFKQWTVYTYAKLMSEQIFLPLQTDNKELVYSPFQCLAQYFISKKYVGIIYKSTVCKNAKNIVLFDKTLAFPTGKIRDFIIEI